MTSTGQALGIVVAETLEVKTGDFMVIYRDFTGFYRDFIGIYRDLW